MTAATTGRELLALSEHCDRAYDRLLALCGTRNDAPRWDDIATLLRERERLLLDLRLAAKPADEGTIPVPKIALDWLNGEAPDADGKWFGECIPQSDVSPKRAYWWRSKFRSMIPALSTTGEPKR